MIDATSIAALIAREFPFQSLTPEELLSVANLFSEESIKAGQVLVSAKTTLQKFYIVYRGKLQAEIKLSSTRKQDLVFNPGDYFGEETLLRGGFLPMSVKAVEDSIIISLDQDKFRELINQFPFIRHTLEFTLESRRLGRSPKFSWLGADEMVFLITRKHIFFLLRSLIIPIIFFLGSIPLLSIGIAEYGASQQIPTAFWMGLGIAMISLLGAIWVWLDWGNDYYIVTNQRVVWIEKILLIYDSRDEAALYNVLSTDVYAPFFGQIFNFGDVFARTFTGQIAMKNSANPYVVASYVDGLRRRAEQLQKEIEAHQMEDAIHQALQRRRAPTPLDVIPVIPAPRPFRAPKKQQEVKRKTGWRARWENFLKVRYEQNGEITYRKALPVLIWKILLPSLLLALWFIGISQLLKPGTGGSQFIWGVMVLALLGLVFWLWYNYTDWRNDIYRLTPTQIFDIEKKPLGSERKKTADIENILTITHERDFIGIIFNFGNVVITVGDTRFIFLTVFNPDRVHQDIANYQEALRQRKRKVEEARAREQMINWLLAYDTESNN